MRAVRHHIPFRSAFLLVLLLCAAAVGGPPLAAAPQAPPNAPQSAADAPESPLTLWYRQPAAQWVEALPVGNGRLGAMVFGGIEHERLQLNEDTLWAGGPYDPSHAAAREALPRVRRLIADGAFADAERLIMEQVIARPPREMPYQTVGDVTITMAGGSSATDYRRSLDLDTAIARTTFRVGGTRYAREVFASPVDQVIVCRLTASEPNAQASAPGRLTATIAMSTPMAASVHAEGDDTVVLAGVNGDAFGIKGALTYQARVRVLAEGGSVVADGTQLRIVAARSATLLIAAATSFRRYDDVSGDPAAATIKAITGSGCPAARGNSYRPHRRASAPVPARDAGPRRRAASSRRPTSGSAASPAAPTRSSPRCTSSTAATCSSRVRGQARSPPTCRASGTTARIRRGPATTPPTSTPR